MIAVSADDHGNESSVINGKHLEVIIGDAHEVLPNLEFRIGGRDD